MTAGEVLNGRVGRTKNKTISCCNKNKKCSTPSLPDDIIFYILVWLPADILYNSTRYVCRQWYNISHNPFFIKEHLLRSTTGLFIQKRYAPHTAQFVEFGKMKSKVTEVSFTFPNEVLACCNGLVLFRDNHNRTVHVANPLTKQMVTVPPFTCLSHVSSLSLACAYSTMEYKVVCTYSSNGGKVFDCAIVTLGKDDTWKPINGGKLSDKGRSVLVLSPFSIGKIIYWAILDHTHVVVLDVESEMFYEFPSPTPVRNYNTIVHYLRKGKSLSCVVSNSIGTLFDVWVLSDPMTGDWRKLDKIDFRDPKFRLRRCLPLFPLAWVNKGDELVFYTSPKAGHYIAFNLKTGKTLWSKSYLFGDCCGWWDYAYSLVSFTSGVNISM